MNPLHLVQCGLAQQQTGALDVAEMFFRQALRLQPREAEALHRLGLIQLQKGRNSAAIDLIRQAIEANDSVPEFHNHLGMALRTLGQIDEAARSYERACELRPDYADAWYNLGNVLKQSGCLEHAIECLRRANVLDPNQPDILTNLGVALKELGQFDEALDCYQAALAHDPDFAEANWNRGVVRMLRGEFSRGWEDYEWRWRVKGLLPPRREFPQPRWEGGELRGRTILVEAEQGFGDTIQFARYVPLLADRGAHVVLECQPALKRLLQSLPGAKAVIAQGEPPPRIDTHASLLSLPRCFGTVLETILVNAPYLRAPTGEPLLPEIIDSERLKVGLAWRGNPANDADRSRSIALAEWLPVLRMPGVDFYSLQCGPAAAELAGLPADVSVVDLSPRLIDFAVTARAIEQLDLIISVCTSVAHLAGALGKPCWTLLATNACWRWLLEREDSPWYPSLRLFRQTNRGEWKPVIERVARSLAARAQMPLVEPRAAA